MARLAHALLTLALCVFAASTRGRGRVGRGDGRLRGGGVTKHLLLDTRKVASVVDGKLMPGAVVKDTRNPLLSDANPHQLRPWEVRYDNMQPNVYYDRLYGKYRLWYSSWTTCQASNATKGTRGACSTKGYWPCSGVAGPLLGPLGRIAALMYSESEDGIVWTKPALGVVKDSSTTTDKTNFSQNNIVLLDNDGTGVLVDEHAPDPRQRYKLFGELDKRGGHKHSRALATSADGIHWNASDFAGSSTLLDRHGTHNNLVFDPVSNTFFGFGRSSNSPYRTESVAQSKTSDFTGQWNPAVPCGLEKDESDTYQPDALVVMTEPYEDTGIYFGFANMLNVTTPTATRAAGTTEIELAWSHDLVHWRYVAHGVPFILRGPPGSYDCCEIFGAKQQPVIDGDTMKIYYTGGNGPFMGSRAAGFSLATLQRDWWFGYTPSKTAAKAGRTWVATIVTTPVVVGAAGMVLISADARQGGVVVGVVGDSRRRPDNCLVLRGNLTDTSVAWSRGADSSPLADLVGQNITLEFLLEPGAVLFAFSV